MSHFHGSFHVKLGKIVRILLDRLIDLVLTFEIGYDIAILKMGTFDKIYWIEIKPALRWPEVGMQ